MEKVLTCVFEASAIHFHIENEHYAVMSGAPVWTGDCQAWIMVARDQLREATDLLEALGIEK